MPFIDGDVVVKEIDVKTWELLNPLVYQGREQTFTVPAGFKTDFASVPKFFTWLVPPYGLYTKAAILHDYIGQNNLVNRSDGDGIFRRAMRELGVSFLRRWLMWAAVRLGGKLADANTGEFITVILIAIPSFLFLALPAAVVILWLAVFWVLEYVVFAALKPFSKKQVNKPHFLVGADAIQKEK